MKTPIQKSIELVGSQTALARSCGVRYQAVQKWIKKGRVPAERVLAIKRATNGRVTRYELRPDLYGEMPYKKIPLTKGRYALIDADDYERLVNYRWHVSALGYAVTWILKDGQKAKEYMHRMILQVPKGFVTDHINGDLLDNRKINLRICSQQENSRNQRGSRNNPSGFKGVSLKSDTGKWRARIMVDRKEINLGCFESAEEAAEAYNAAARKHFGDYARLNPVSSAPKEDQAA
ncbi:Cro/CI family transcriptional regulator [Nitrosococcus halophilus]|uniref:Cro/CI family transcriptional regulator n=1 Tax=Nitrosococcus halophilus TaxID=133539 RepID=UPI0006743957|nr:Cro/CI family transcriptional regulator [Nitrosococcus halophilus]